MPKQYMPGSFPSVPRILGRPGQIVLAFPPDLAHVLLRRLQVGRGSMRASGGMGARPGVAFYASGADVDLARVHRLPVRRDRGLLGEGEVGLVAVYFALVRHLGAIVSSCSSPRGAEEHLLVCGLCIRLRCKLIGRPGNSLWRCSLVVK